MTTAHLLSEAEISVVVIERLNQTGGLARSFFYDGFIFDVGPHRFHTDNPAVTTYVDRLLKDHSTLFPRCSEVFFHGDYYRWPLHPKQLVQLPPDIAIRSGLDLLANSLRSYEITSFENYVLRQYGPTLYTHFFKDYSQKFLGIHPADTHPDWAKAGINRAIIDDKMQMQNLTQLLISTFLQFNKADIDFIYPLGGMQSVWNRVQALIEARGGRVITGVEARLERKGDMISAVRAGDERFEPSLVIWTGPINAANRQLGLPEANLPHRALLLFNVMSKADVPRRYQWCYYGEQELVFNRISMPRFFSADTCPAGHTGLCVEVTCMEGDQRWNNAEHLTDWVVDDLIRVRMIPNRRAVQDVRLERIQDSYPIYHAHYPRDLERAQEALSSISNLHMAGRNGTFWYNNMDHCIEAAMATVRQLLQGAGQPGLTDEDLARGPDPQG